MDGDGDCDEDDVVLFSDAYDNDDLAADWNYNCEVDPGDVSRFWKMYSIGGAEIGDFDLNGVANLADFSAFYAAWQDGYTGGTTIANISNRFTANGGDGDCVTNLYDLQLGLAWIPYCP